MKYKYEVWMDGSMLTESYEYEYESEEEALEEGLDAAEDIIQQWKADESWDGETLEDFDVRTKEA